MKAWIIPSIAAFAAAGSGLWILDLKDEVQPPHKPAGLEEHETHAAVSLLGQFRTSISAWLWVRTDLYLHNGVEMRPLTQLEKVKGHQGTGSSDDPENKFCDHSSITTTIPDKEKDFRGIFGDIERSVSTYKEMSNHAHNSPKDALPLYRLMTWIDPGFVRGWSLGSYVMTYGKTNDRFDKAIAFLRKGIEENPHSVVLQQDLGVRLLTDKHDFHNSELAFESAIQNGRRAEFQKLSHDEKEGLEQAYFWMTLIQKQKGALDEQYAYAVEGLRLFPDSIFLKRQMLGPPIILTKDTQKRYLELFMTEGAHQAEELPKDKKPKSCQHEHDGKECDHDHGHDHKCEHDHSHDDSCDHHHGSGHGHKHDDDRHAGHNH